jgi:hypothetical protein
LGTVLPTSGGCKSPAAFGSKRVGAPMTVVQAIMFGVTPSLVLLALLLCRERFYYDDEG